MTINHATTRSEILKIRDVLANLGTQATNFNNEKGKLISNEDLSQKAKSERIEELGQAFKGYAMQSDEKIQIHLDKILETELENKKIFDVTDPALQSAINLLQATNGKVNHETIRNLVKQFRGNYQALEMLSSLFESKDIQSKDIKRYIFDIESAIERLKDNTIHADADSGSFKIVAFCKELFKLGELLGEDFDEKEQAVNVDLEEYQEALARRVMGLSY